METMLKWLCSSAIVSMTEKKSELKQRSGQEHPVNHTVAIQRLVKLPVP